jgi:DNA (cytosine-5)-methyltransferase 1
MLRHVDLCSGIGGFSLGFSWAELSRTIMFCDTEEWCRKILAKNFNNVPIAKDVKELANDPERNVPNHDILTCGYPCQPFSVAGLRKGEEDDRHIWPFLFKIIARKRPTWVVCENVYGHVALGLDKVLADLESEGYATRTFIVPACSKNAHHRRDRLWIICKNVGDSSSGRGGKFRVSGEEIGNAESEEAQSIRTSTTRGDVADSNFDQHKREDRGRDAEKEGDEEQKWTQHSSSWKSSRTSESWVSHQGHAREQTMAYSKCLGWEQRSKEQGEFDREESSDQLDFGSEGCTRSRSSSHVAYTSSEGLQGWNFDTTISEGGEKESQLGNKSSRVYTDEGIWFAEPNVGRVAHGIPKRMDRLKGLGNAIVPSLAMQIGLAIKEEIEKDG